MGQFRTLAGTKDLKHRKIKNAERRMLGGSLLAHRAQHSQERESGLFDIVVRKYDRYARDTAGHSDLHTANASDDIFDAERSESYQGPGDASQAKSCSMCSMEETCGSKVACSRGQQIGPSLP